MFMMMKEFFLEYGLIAGLDINYSKYMDMLEDSACRNKFLEMTSDGTFILEGKERYFVSHELKMKSEMFVLNKECIVNITYHSVIIKIVDYIIYINVESIYKDIKRAIGECNINIYSILCHINIDIGYITRILQKISDERTAVYIVTMLNIDKKEAIDIETFNIIKNKIFGDCTNFQMLCTILIMITHCNKPNSDRDSYQFKYINTAPLIIYKSLKNNSVFNLYSILKTGKLTIRGSVYDKMASIISRRSKLDALSSVRKIAVLVNENSPNIPMRMIHDSQRGFICPSETSDGKNAGLSKYLACTCVISGYINKDRLLKYLDKFTDNEGRFVVVDGLCVGTFNIDRYIIKSKFRMVSIYELNKVYYIRTIDGRPMRPMYVKGKDILHMIDPAEQIYHADEYTEYSAISLFGLSATLIPYGNYNQSARVIFSTHMIKQAMESRRPHTVYEEHRRLVCGQSPIVKTITSGLIDDGVPNGVNILIAITTYSGFNQEDSIVINKAAVDRGLFHNIYYKNISHIVSPGYKVIEGDSPDVIEYVINNNSEVHVVKKPSKGDYKLINAFKTGVERTRSVRSYRVPEIGDKFASRHAQKSIASIFVNPEDMPVTETGMIPDMIINPHAIPSRMTIGQLIESLEGKVGCIEGKFIDGTMFSKNNYVEDLQKYNDTEYLIDGRSGEYISNPVTIGIVYYMALKQQVQDKLFSRYGGPQNAFSRQPTSGKARNGGLRIGEMEYDALISHGAYNVINSIIDQSDAINVRICKTCKKRIHKNCPLNHNISTVRVPMSRVVTEDLLCSMCIGTKVIF